MGLYSAGRSFREPQQEEPIDRGQKKQSQIQEHAERIDGHSREVSPCSSAILLCPRTGSPGARSVLVPSGHTKDRRWRCRVSDLGLLERNSL